MPSIVRNRFATAAIFLSLLASAALTGCGVGMQAPAVSTGDAKPGVAIQGNAHGGAYPIQKALVTLMETQSTGYGAAGKVLEQVTSHSDGYFSFDNKWTCDTGQYAYIVVSSGHTAANATNNNVLQVGVIGSCSADLATTAEISGVNVFVSELSTVAAAYSLGNFIGITTDPTYGLLANISSPTVNNVANPTCTGTGTGTGGMTCNAAGLAHGFANAFNLVDSVRYDGSFPSGQARVTLPGNSQATVPQAMINTIGNILQSCVDSPGGGVTGSAGSYATDGSHCGDLFLSATPPAGTAPTNTLQVALNMAKYPNNNVDQLFKLQPRAVFFTPDLAYDTLSDNSSAYMAFTLSIFYLGTGLSGDTGIPYPVDLALDAQDNAYVLYTGASGSGYAALDSLAANGAGVFAGPHQASIGSPAALALDGGGYAWVTNDSSAGGVSSLNTPNTGGTYGTIASTLTVTNGNAAGLAIDASNNVWVTRDSSDRNQSLFIFQKSNGYASINFQKCTGSFTIFTFTYCYQYGNNPPVLGVPSKRVTIDGSQDLWGVTSSGSSQAQTFIFAYGELGNTANLYTSTLDTTGGFGIAVNKSNQAFLPLSGTLDTSAASNTGTFTPNIAGSWTGASGSGSTFTTPMGTAVDGAGNIFWTDSEATGQVFMMTPSSTGSVSSGTLISFSPCNPSTGQCSGSANPYLRSMAIDSSGAMWYASNGSSGTLIQTLGLASPTWPLLSYTHSGQPVDNSQ